MFLSVLFCLRCSNDGKKWEQRADLSGDFKVQVKNFRCNNSTEAECTQRYLSLAVLICELP
jgi:hypothetical protein